MSARGAGVAALSSEATGRAVTREPGVVYNNRESQRARIALLERAFGPVSRVFSGLMAGASLNALRELKA